MNPRKLKILQVSYDFNIGGLQRVVVDLAEGLRNLGHEVHVCSLRGTGPMQAELEKMGIPCFPLPWREGRANRGQFLRVLALIWRHRYDVIHTHNTQPFLDGGLAAVLARTPVRIHTDHARSFPDRRRYMIMERLMSYWYDKVVAVSQATLENLVRYEGIARRKLMVILNGIDGDRYRQAMAEADPDELRRKYALDPEGQVIGLGVRLEEQKGLEYLLSAMPAVLAKHPHTTLAIAGQGSLATRLKALIQDLQVAGHVKLLGAFPDLTRFYPLLNAFVLPSLWEGLPLCILEAMSLGLPILATRVGGVPQLLEDGKEALLVEPRDPEALANAIVHLLENPSEAKALGINATRKFDVAYGRQVMCGKYLDLYRAYI